MALWQMNGATIAASTTIANPGTAWQVQAVGGLTGDGRADIVWRNTTDGSVVEWTMNGPTIASSAAVSNPGLEWHLT